MREGCFNVNAEMNRNARRDKKSKKYRPIKHAGVGGFPVEVWLKRKGIDPLVEAKKCKKAV